MFQTLSYEDLQALNLTSKRVRINKSNFTHHLIKGKEHYYIKGQISEIGDGKNKDKPGLEQLLVGKEGTFALIENNFNLDCPSTRAWFKEECPESLRRENTLIVAIYEFHPQAEEYKDKYITNKDVQIDGRFIISGLKCPSI